MIIARRRCAPSWLSMILYPTHARVIYSMSSWLVGERVFMKELRINDRGRDKSECFKNSQNALCCSEIIGDLNTTKS